MEKIIVPKGLEGVVVDKTSISSTDSEGNLIYRGYEAAKLAEKCSFEDVAHLIVNGKLPDGEEHVKFSEELRSLSSIDDNIISLIKAMQVGMPMIDMLRTVISGIHVSGSDEKLISLGLAAKMPNLITKGYNILKGTGPYDEIKGTYAERFYHGMTGSADKGNARYLEKLMILYMEHEFNASTFALRVTASTLAGPQAAFTSALATLKGPLHGGANSEILKYILTFKSKSDAIGFIDRKLEAKEKVMGFGHRIYKLKDPRAQFIKGELKKLSEEKQMPEIYDYASAMEDHVWEKKSIPANVDFYAAIYMHLLGIGEEFYLPVFAAARSFGWVAHYAEQVESNKLIRPDSEYIGPKGLDIKA